MVERHSSVPLVDLTAAAVPSFWRFRRLAQVLLRIKIELLFAIGAAEVIRLPLVLSSSGGGSSFDVHAAHMIFHGCCALHCGLSFARRKCCHAGYAEV